KEMHPYYNLSVTVLRAQNIQGADLLSKADCYVQLKLPTASPLPYRTKVVYNSTDPEWNETFHYRIHGAIKNILELTLYDRDLMLDDKLSAVVFDVGSIKPGQTIRRAFKLNPKHAPAQLIGQVPGQQIPVDQLLMTYPDNRSSTVFSTENPFNLLLFKMRITVPSVAVAS
ncbi:hypothetical protein GDO78_017842, partial [Eleutherodactylus coqui]